MASRSASHSRTPSSISVNSNVTKPSVTPTHPLCTRSRAHGARFSSRSIGKLHPPITLNEYVCLRREPAAVSGRAAPARSRLLADGACGFAVKVEQGDEAGGGGKPENHEGPVFANERRLPHLELTQRDRGLGGRVGVDQGDLIARSGKNAGGSFRRAQHEPAGNNSSVHRSRGRKA